MTMMTDARSPETAPDREPPMLHYRTAGGAASTPAEAPPSPEAPSSAATDSLADRIVRWLTLGILGVVLSIWAVVGAVFWLPLLVRTMVRFSLSLVQSTMDAQRPESSARTLRDAVSFYRRGFVLAIDAVLRPDTSPSRGTGHRERIDGDRMVKELLWAVGIWYVVLWGIGIAWSPGEIWAAVLAWPWGEAWGALTGWIGSALEGLVGPEAAPPADVVPPTEVPGPTG